VSAVPEPTPIVDAYTASWNSQARPVRASRRPWRVARILLFALAGFAVGIAAAASLPTVLGFQGFAVLSGSMEPTIGTGDVVVVRKIAPLDARPGDVVTFRSPEDPAKIITHRVTRMEATGDSVGFVTKGDANTGTEQWAVPTTGTIGKVEYRIPKLGYVTNRIGSRVGRFAFLILPALVLALVELRRIWRPEQKGQDVAGSE
jgi:signal peptidase I